MNIDLLKKKINNNHFIKKNKKKYNIKLYDLFIKKKIIYIYVSFNNPTYHFKEKINKEIKNSIINIKNIIKIKIINKINKINNNKIFKINNIKYIIIVASGKGGVGKSTLSTNICICLNKLNFKVGLLDLDIYGPSIPCMFNINNKYKIFKDKDTNKIIPLIKYNIKLMSMGFLINKDESVLVRGPMASNIIYQLINNVKWGKLDFLIIDLPPCTNDIHISLINNYNIFGAILISTPQEVAILDLIKSINMLKNKKFNIKILGLVENMSFFLIKNKKYYIFDKNGVLNLSKNMNIPFLGKIPLIKNIRKYSDLGIPFSLKNYDIYKIYNNILYNMFNYNNIVLIYIIYCFYNNIN